jgi:hypothetical protein
MTQAARSFHPLEVHSSKPYGCATIIGNEMVNNYKGHHNLMQGRSLVAATNSNINMAKPWSRPTNLSYVFSGTGNE